MNRNFIELKTIRFLIEPMWKRQIVYSFSQCRNLSNYLCLLEALLSPRLILFITSVSTVSFLIVSQIEKELLRIDKLKNSSLIFDLKSCVTKTIDNAGNNIFPNYPAKSLIRNVGKINIPIYHAMSTTVNAGNNFSQLYHAILKILNAGGDWPLILKEQLLIKPLKNLEKQKIL